MLAHRFSMHTALVNPSRTRSYRIVHRFDVKDRFTSFSAKSLVVHPISAADQRATRSHAGTLERWNAGTLERWNAGTNLPLAWSQCRKQPVSRRKRENVTNCLGPASYWPHRSRLSFFSYPNSLRGPHLAHTVPNQRCSHGTSNTHQSANVDTVTRPCQASKSHFCRLFCEWTWGATRLEPGGRLADSCQFPVLS